MVSEGQLTWFIIMRISLLTQMDMSYHGAEIYLLNLGLPSSKYEYITVFHGALDAHLLCINVCVDICVYLSM